MPAWWWAAGARWTGMTRRSFSIAYKHIHTSTTTCLHHVYHSLFMWLLTQLRWRRARHAAPRRAVLPVAVAVELLLVQLQKVESYILLLCQALLMCFGSSFLIECHHPTTAGSICWYVTGPLEPGVPRYPRILADQLTRYLNRCDRLCRTHCYWPPRIIRPSYGPDICSMNRSSLGGKKSF